MRTWKSWGTPCGVVCEVPNNFQTRIIQSRHGKYIQKRTNEKTYNNPWDILHGN